MNLFRHYIPSTSQNLKKAYLIFSPNHTSATKARFTANPTFSNQLSLSQPKPKPDLTWVPVAYQANQDSVFREGGERRWATVRHRWSLYIHNPGRYSNGNFVICCRARAGVSWRRRAKFHARAAAAETQRARAITQTYPPPPFAFPLQVPCVILGILDC